MLRYRDGDVSAFEALYTRYKGALYRYLLRQCGQVAIAEELFQDVWLHIVRTHERYTVRAKFTTYLFHLAHNRLVDYYRQQVHRAAGSHESVDGAAALATLATPATALEERAHARRQVSRLLKLLPTLPAEQREAFLLHEEAGLSVEEIAAVTGVHRETAKSRLRYAVSRLQRGLRGEV
jgi:RNA polymerase sigma-70 factor (ECF subfamily)